MNPGQTAKATANVVAGVPFKGAGLLNNVYKGINGFISSTIKSIPALAKSGTLMGRFGAVLTGTLGPLGAIAGIATGIWAGLKVLQKAPMILEWVIDKVSNIFTLENMSKVFSGIWSIGTKILSGVYNLIGGAVHGIAEVALRGIFAAVNFFAGTDYKTDSQILYQQNKKISEQEEELNKRRLAAAEREKEIMAIRAAAAESEEKWYEIQKKINKQRMDIAIERFSPKEQQEYVQEQIDRLAPKVYSFENQRGQLAANRDTAAKENEKAKKATSDIKEDDPVRKAFDELMDKYNNNRDDVIRNTPIKDRDKMLKLINARESENKFNSINDNLIKRQNEYDENKSQLLGMQGKKWQLKFDNAAKMGEENGDLAKRKKAYQDIQDEIINSSPLSVGKGEFHGLFKIGEKNGMIERRQKIQDEINKLDTQMASSVGQKSAEELQRLEDEKKRLEQQLGEYDTGIAQIRAYEADIDKTKQEIDKITKEQLEKHKGYQSQLFDFQFSNAKKPQQRKMAVQKFWDENNNFDGLKSLKEKEEAFGRMKEMYDKLEKSETPTWNGIKSSTSAAVESGSVQAKEMENRILNDINKVLVENSKEQTMLQKTMTAALKELVKMSDPHYVGGSIGK